MLLVVSGCQEDPPYQGAFNMPVAAAVVHPESGGPYEEPIGFVANGHGGAIALLALKQGRFVPDDDTASFARSNYLPTGGARLLTAVAGYAPTDDQMSVFAADKAWGHVVHVPWITGVDGRGVPIEGTPLVATDAVFLDHDDSGDNGSLADVELKRGYTTTEDWTLTFDGEFWWVDGSRSGRQAYVAQTDVPYVADERRVAFTIQGAASLGDQITFSTDNGITELDVGGMPQQLSMAPDQSRLAVVAQDGDSETTRLRWYHPATFALIEDTVLGDGSSPWRVSWAPDGAALCVSDLNRPAVWEVSMDGTDPIEHVLPAPTFDVAVLYGDDGKRRLFAAASDGRTIYMYDLDEGRLIDVNPNLPGDQGMSFLAAINGIDGLQTPHLYHEHNDWGTRLFGQSVGVSLASGRVVFIEEATGCLMRDILGPRTTTQGTFGTTDDYETNFDGFGSPPFLERNAHNTRHVLVNACAGIAKTERWVMRYDRNRTSWRVEGSTSGEQGNLAFEDARYVSDAGEVSLVVRSGGSPTGDGWEIQFDVLEGAVSVDGDNDGDGNREVILEAPMDPVYFHYTVGPTPNTWKKVDDRALLLVPAAGGDTVGRIDPQEGDADAEWL